jgi:hypothetical protein
MRKQPVLASEIVRYAVINIRMDKHCKEVYERESGRLVDSSSKAEIEQYVNERFDLFYDFYHERE